MGVEELLGKLPVFLRPGWGLDRGDHPVAQGRGPFLCWTLCRLNQRGWNTLSQAEK